MQEPAYAQRWFSAQQIVPQDVSPRLVVQIAGAAVYVLAVAQTWVEVATW